MSMKFTLTLTGDVEQEAEAEDIGIDTDNIGDLLGVYNSDVEFDDASVSGTVTFSARVTVRNVEVAASDLKDYDADTAIQEAVAPYGGAEVSGSDFDITEEPTGFDEVVAALGYDRDEAIKVYAALDAAGYEVN